MVPVGGMSVINESSTPSPLSLPSLPVSLSPSLSPSLISAPSAVSNIPAVALPVLNSQSVAVQTPLSLTAAALSPTPTPAALITSPLPAPSKSDSARQEVIRAASPAKVPPVDLDVLFDGSLPHSSVLLSRAAALNLSPAALGLALSESPTPLAAAARLKALGVLGPREASLASSDEEGFRFLMTRVWRAAAPTTPSSIEVDASWTIPALKIVRDGSTYFVHGVTHGRFGPPRRGAVLNLAREIVRSGGTLYSEQNLPAYYGYALGRETLDHASAAGAAARIGSAAGGQPAAALLAARAINWLVSPGSALAALAWVALRPDAPLAWLALAAASVFAWLVLTGGLPLMRWKRRRLAARARAEGLEDIADQYADEARHFFIAKPDLETLRGLELPQPLGAQEGDPYWARSRAMADAVAAEAAAAGASAVHLIVGHMHAHEVAWRLAQGPRAAVPGSQKS